MKKLIWDKLPDCLLDKIYNYIYFPQSKSLLDDIVSYKYTIDYILNIINDNEYYPHVYTWYILWSIIILIEKGLNSTKAEKMEKLQYFVMNNNNKMIQKEGGLYWIKRYIKKISKNDRENLIKILNLNNI
tara:strand:- start:1432 stop:1821 length:390 start_codon:yes stop_codon:yes gene_type:complete